MLVDVISGNVSIGWDAVERAAWKPIVEATGFVAED
ncbi:hypothetical protein LMG23992_05284 [Cupriavidus laharis]|uniref:Uncharacterized protein n=1 Tax=Cupriavidus laharis TaxID=151654 RepID=A0ABM8XW45_9BURK|nr:hypothetical protein LMG23992_05284 [Cupriavidus laharis]